MMTISNIGAKQASSYYEKDGYYARINDQDDKWFGNLKDKLNLPDTVIKDDFNQLVREREQRAGFDLCFSAPKSVSIAMVMDEPIRKDMIAAHEKAVESILGRIEQREIGARVTAHKKTELVKTGNMIAGRFNHYVSRANDPQLHTHCVILNKTFYNGKYYAVANESLYQNKSYYGQLYRNALAEELLKRGYDLTVTNRERGYFELSGISSESIQHFSKRRAEIQAKLKEWGTTSELAGSQAALRTRNAKEHKDLGLLMESWRDTLHEMNQPGIARQMNTSAPDELQIKAEFERALNHMSRKTFAFTEEDFQKTFLAYGVGLGLNEEQCNACFQAEIGRDIYVLGQRKDGLDTRKYYCTSKSYQMEKEIFAEVEKTKNTMEAVSLRKARAFVDHLGQDNTGRPMLNDEQKQAVQMIASTKDQYFSVQGLAGTGKTHMLKYTRQVLEENGFEVRGACYTGKAAYGLQKDAQISSGTIHSFLNRLEREAGHTDVTTDFKNKAGWNFEGLKPGVKKEVWMVDEASLVDNLALRHLMKAAELKEAKVVFIGDRYQHTPVGVGNAFSNVVENHKINYVKLEENVRQKEVVLRKSVIESVRGDIHQSFDLIKNKIQNIPKKQERFKAIVRDYLALTPEQRDHTVVLTAGNADRKALNRGIRNELKKEGALPDGLKFDVAGETGVSLRREFSVNDKVIFLQNDNRVGVQNGQTGFIEAIEGHTLTVVSDKDPNRERIVIKVNLDEYKHLDHGYAMTSHKAQGITEERALIHLDSAQTLLNSRNAFYVDISRAKYEVKLYTDDLKKVKGQVKEFAKKLTSDDFTLSLAALKDPAGAPDREGPEEISANLDSPPYEKMFSQYQDLLNQQDNNISFTDYKTNISQEGLNNEFEQREHGSTIDWRTVGDRLANEETRVSKQLGRSENERNRVPKQPGHEVAGDIQRQVRAVEERTDRITKGIVKQQPDLGQQNIGRSIPDPGRGPKRGRGLEF